MSAGREAIGALVDVVLEGKKHVSHSSASELKRVLLGHPKLDGAAEYLAMGREFHRMVLQPHLRGERLSRKSREACRRMAASLARLESLAGFIRRAEKEAPKMATVCGVSVKVVLDAFGARRSRRCGVDLKMTAASSPAEFKAAAVKYGYFRQAWLYCEALGLNEFYIVAVQKKSPHKVFFLDALEDKKQITKAKKEAIWLLTLFKERLCRA